MYFDNVNVNFDTDNGIVSATPLTAGRLLDEATYANPEVPQFVQIRSDRRARAITRRDLIIEPLGYARFESDLQSPGDSPTQMWTRIDTGQYIVAGNILLFWKGSEPFGFDSDYQLGEVSGSAATEITINGPNLYYPSRTFKRKD